VFGTLLFIPEYTCSEMHAFSNNSRASAPFCLESRKTYGKGVLTEIGVLQFSLQLQLETLLAPINLYSVTLEMGTETHVVFHVKSHLLLFDINQNKMLLKS
jgi:hypothetical protein